MAKKRRLADMRMHDYCLAIAQQDVEKKERNEKRRKVKRGGDMSMSDKPKKITFRYRRHMRIGGITPRNKNHARELWEAKWSKHELDMEEMDIDGDQRSKKRRKVEAKGADPKSESMDYEVVKVDKMGLEVNAMKATMTMGSKRKVTFK